MKKSSVFNDSLSIHPSSPLHDRGFPSPGFESLQALLILFPWLTIYHLSHIVPLAFFGICKGKPTTFKLQLIYHYTYYLQIASLLPQQHLQLVFGEGRANTSTSISFLPCRSANTNYSQAPREKGVAVLSQNLQAQALTRNVINVCHLLSYVCLWEGREGYSWLPGYLGLGLLGQPRLSLWEAGWTETLAKAAAAPKPLQDPVISRKSSTQQQVALGFTVHLAIS